MDSDPKSHDKYESNRYPRDIDATYILDPDTGIYKPKSVQTDQERRRKSAGTDWHTRFFTDPRTDWRPIRVATVISLLTTFLLGLTVHYANLQWVEMRRATNETAKSAKAAESAAKTADANFKSSQRQFRNEQRPLVWFSAGIFIPGVVTMSETPLPDLVKRNTPLQISALAMNGGRSPASAFTVTDVSVFYDSPAIVAKKAREYKPLYASDPGSVLMPGSSSYLATTTPMVLTNDMLKDMNLMAPKKTLLIIGRTRYTDIFSPTIPPYESQFCFMLHPEGMPFGDCGNIGQAWIK